MLGLDVVDTARRLVRLLLTDALEGEQGWEQQLLSSSSGYDRGVLIRYGQPSNPNLPLPKTSIPILNIAIPLLENQNIEILVSSVSSLKNGNGPHSTPVDIFLSPTVGTPTAASGRQTMISQPVHSSLVVANGLSELLQLSELLASTAFVSDEEKSLVSVALEQRAQTLDSQDKVFVVNLDVAEAGLAAIRRSLSEASDYEHKWNDSGVPAASGWLALAARSQPPIPPAVAALVSTLLVSASRSINIQEQAEVAASERLGISLATSTNLVSAIDDFSRNAHQELQSGLSSAWSSRNWRKLAWYKLFWRVDDVGLIVSDLINNAWLPRTERAVYELSGRLAQTGISPVDIAIPEPLPETVEVEEAAPSTESLTLLASATTTETQPSQPIVSTDSANVPHIEMVSPPRPVPLSSIVSSSRQISTSNAILTLQSQAQQLVLRTLSISGLSAGLSGLTYFTLTPGSLYEAGTIFALGTTYALYRMQGGWQYTTREVEAGLFEKGREVITDVTVKMRRLVEQATERREDGQVMRRRREAKEAIERARLALEKVVNGGEDA